MCRRAVFATHPDPSARCAPGGRTSEDRERGRSSEWGCSHTAPQSIVPDDCASNKSGAIPSAGAPDTRFRASCSRCAAIVCGSSADLRDRASRRRERAASRRARAGAVKLGRRTRRCARRGPARQDRPWLRARRPAHALGAAARAAEGRGRSHARARRGGSPRSSCAAGATARGVGIGANAAAIRAAFPRVRFDHRGDATFGLTIARVPKGGGGRLEFGVDTTTKRVTLIGIPRSRSATERRLPCTPQPTTSSSNSIPRRRSSPGPSCGRARAGARSGSRG